MSPVVVVRDLAYELANGRELFKNLSFSLTAGRTALVGPNGIGKTTLARLIAGELEPTTGSIQRHGPIKILPQRLQPEPITVAEFLANHHQWSLTRERLLANIDHDTLCTHLSGGQWTRVRLVQALEEGFLILDEPTNNLDLANIEFLENVVAQFRGALIMVSHDQRFLENCGVTTEFELPSG